MCVYACVFVRLLTLYVCSGMLSYSACSEAFRHCSLAKQQMPLEMNEIPVESHTQTAP